MKLSESLKSKWIDTSVQNEALGQRGWSSIFAEHPVYEGLYYCEVTVLEPKLPLPFENVVPHVRIGVGTKDSNVELPIGADDMSYCYRDRDGCLLNQGIAYQYAHSYNIGDTIGILIHLQPPKPKIKPKKEKDINKEKEYIDYSQNFISQQMISNQSINSYSKIPLYANNNNNSNNNNNNDNNNNNGQGRDRLNQDNNQNNQNALQLQLMRPEGLALNQDSFVYFFKNGVNQGLAFRNMKEGFYYVGASLYMNSRVRFNFGPDFNFPIDLEKEGIIIDEDIVLKPYDMISKEQIPYNDII